jgi:hypothetical protein
MQDVQKSGLSEEGLGEADVGEAGERMQQPCKSSRHCSPYT